MKKAWFKHTAITSKILNKEICLKCKVGEITDIYDDYIELKEIETGEYYIKHNSLVEIIK